MPSSLIKLDPPGGPTPKSRRAWAYEGGLLPVLLPILAVLLLGTLALDLVPGRDHLMIIDGGLAFPEGTGLVVALKAVLTGSTWLVALTAGAVAAVGARRGRPVDPRAAIAVALRQFPALALALGVAAGVMLATLWVAGGVAGAAGGTPGTVVLVAVLAALAVAAARLLLGVVTRVFGGSPWALTRGRLVRTAGVLLVGGVGAPVLGALVWQQLRAGLPVPVLPEALDAVLLVGVLALQATLLARTYLLPRGDAQVALAGADLDAVDARLASMAGRRPRWMWWGAAATALPVVLSAGIAATNPSRALSIRTGDGVGAVAAAWPAGQHPVVATDAGVRFCEDDLCDRYVAHNAMPSVDGWSTTTIGPDGTVVTAATTGGPDNGGPFIEYARCTRGGCQHEWLPVRASAREPYGSASLAGAAAPDGSVWFAVATATPYDASGPRAYAFSMIRCPRVPCAQPERHLVGAVRQAPQDDTADGRRARISIGSDGRPVASFRLGSRLHVVTCDPVTCANPRADDLDAEPRDAVSTTPAGLDDRGVALKRGTLKIGDDWFPLASDVAPGSGALAVSGPQLYATVAEETTTPRAGLHISVGATPKRWQQVLWRCERAHCDRPERIPLDVLAGAAGREVMAVGPTGRVLILRDDRTILLTTTP